MNEPTTFDIVFPLTVLVLLGIGMPILLFSVNWMLAKWAVGSRNVNPGKLEPYESGLGVTVGTAGEKFSVKFYLIAMLFLAFDIEVAFLYPWAVQFNKGGWEMVGLLAVFLVLLEVGYLYLYRKGAFDWDK
jgi:NADH-quinone oxidoreductase subunit A